jgi:hypothetical protein
MAQAKKIVLAAFGVRKGAAAPEVRLQLACS